MICDCSAARLRETSKRSSLCSRSSACQIYARGLRPAVQQHEHRRLPQAQSQHEGADAGGRRHGDRGNRTPSCATLPRPARPTAHRRDACEKTQVERWMDWMLGALNAPFLAVFKEAKKPAARAQPEFAPQSTDLVGQLKILTGTLRARLVRARSPDHCRHRVRAGGEALPRIPDRAAGVA